MKKLFIIIPAYNEEKSIAELIYLIPRISGIIIKVIVVDDGSTDNTGVLAREAGAIVLRNKINKGLASTFLKGLEYCIKQEANFIVLLDGDFQYNPDQIPLLLLPLIHEKCQLSMGNRFLARSFKEASFFNSIANYLISFIISRVITKRGTLFDVQSSFRGFTRGLGIYLTRNLRGNYNYAQEFFILTSLQGFKIAQIPVQCQERKYGKSRLIKNPVIHIFEIMKISIQTWLRFFLKN